MDSFFTSSESNFINQVDESDGNNEDDTAAEENRPGDTDLIGLIDTSILQNERSFESPTADE
jgi:hypothetical protein